MLNHHAGCEALAEALSEDPFYQAVIVDGGPTPAQRHAALVQYFALAIEEGMQVGEVRFAAHDGVAIWHTGQGTAQTRAHHGRVRLQGLQRSLGPVGFDNFNRVCAGMAQQTPPELQDAWYLSILGVRAQARGRGLAQALLAPTLARADREQVVCFLETFNPRSLPFYHRLGFGHDMLLREAVTEQPYWLLSRTPQPLRRPD